MLSVDSKVAGIAIERRESLRARPRQKRKLLKLMTGFKKKEKISVDYFDTETAEMRNAEMYMDGFKSKLEKDTSYKGLWTVSFCLKEL